jgi:hypothetical protein
MDEVRRWPGVSERAMFGMQGFYRGEKMFAALPKSRTIGRNSFIFKLQPVPSKLKARLQDEPRIDTSHPRRWFPFELTGESDLRAALERLHVAYENAPELVFARKKRLRKLPDSHGG